MRKLMLLCAVLAIITGIVSVNLWRELRTERELTAGLQARAAEAAERGSDPALTAQPAVTAAPAVSMDQAPASEPESPAAQRAGDMTASERISRLLAADAALAKDAEYRKGTLEKLRMDMPQNYPGLVEELGLTPGEAGELFDLLAEVQSDKMLANATNPLGGQPGGPPPEQAFQELMRARQEIELRRDQSLVAILGIARHEQFKEYEEGRPARNRVAQLGRTLASVGQPLSDAQTRPLTVVFIAEEKRRNEFSQKIVGELQPGEPVDQARIDEASLDFQAESNRRILEAAQPHLSVQQLETLRAELDRPLAQSRARARIMREQSEK